MKLTNSPGRCDRIIIGSEHASRSRRFRELVAAGARDQPRPGSRSVQEQRAHGARWSSGDSTHGGDWLDLGFSGSSLRLRRFRAASERGLALHAHGGGWVLGGAAQQDGYLRQIAEMSGVTVLSVEYRLAPEAPFPAALDDVTAALCQVIEGDDTGQQLPPVVVFGESAGANLLVGALCALRTHPRFKRIAAASLHYGTFDLREIEARLAAQPEPLLLGAELAHWFLSHYAPDRARDDPRLSPVLADLRGLPPAQFLVGNADPVFTDSAQLADGWGRAGGDATLVEVELGLHGLLEMLTPVTTIAREHVATFLAAACDRFIR